jgi:hypothetical protein
MIRRSTLIAVEILLGLVAALAIGLGVAWWRFSQGPIELNSMRDQIETELSEARSGRPVGIERVELAWSARNALELRAIGVTVEDGRGGVLSRSDEARISLERAAAADRADFSVARRVRWRRHDLHAPARWRDADRVWSRGRAARHHHPRIEPLNENLEERVARVLDSMEDAFKPVGAGGSLREISVRGAKLTLVNEESGGRWTADAANFELSRRGRSLCLWRQTPSLKARKAPRRRRCGSRRTRASRAR